MSISPHHCGFSKPEGIKQSSGFREVMLNKRKTTSLRLMKNSLSFYVTCEYSRKDGDAEDTCGTQLNLCLSATG